MNKKIYYHLIEDSGNGNLGYQGCYMTLEEAQNEADRLADLFPSHFTVISSNSKKEPPITTV